VKTNVRESSIDCYRGIDLTCGQSKVIAFLVEHPGEYTRNELAKLSGIPINAVCGRINELIEAGAVEERMRRADRYTGKQSHGLRLAPRQAALALA
jgi:predicted transcriptional regulator